MCAVGDGLASSEDPPGGWGLMTCGGLWRACHQQFDRLCIVFREDFHWKGKKKKDKELVTDVKKTFFDYLPHSTTHTFSNTATCISYNFCDRFFVKV